MRLTLGTARLLPLPLVVAGAMITTSCGGGGSGSGQATQAASPLKLEPVKTVAVTTSAEGGSARPELVVTATRAYVVYLGNIASGANRSFDVKIFGADLEAVIASRTIVSPGTQYGSPTDIRIASDGDALFAFYETHSGPAATTYLWGAKFRLDDDFTRMAFTSAPIASSRPMADPPDGHELLDDPAPLVGPGSVYVVTRYDHSLSMAGNTVYRVREFDKDSLAPMASFDLDLSAVADGRGRVASLLYWNDSIYMALATTVSDQGLRDGNDDGAPSDVVLVKMKPDWTFDPLTDVRTVSSEPDDRENYITGLRTDGDYLYLSYKQAVGTPPTGQQKAVIKIFDSAFKLLVKEEVKSIQWGSGEIRPSLEISGNHIYSGQAGGSGIGTGNAQIHVYTKN